jgi:hypothetical protein
MPYTLNGIGTKYYGKRDLESDNSFITTEWIVLVYVPIIPIGSFRVQPTGESKNIIFFSSTQYWVQRVPFNWKQIRNVYATTIGIFGAIFGAGYLLQIASPKDPDLDFPVTAPIQVDPSSYPKSKDEI